MALLLQIPLIFSSALTGCASRNTAPPEPKKRFVFLYEHQSFGEVTELNKNYLLASKECEEKIYINGVTINGSIEYDRKKLNRIFSRSKMNHIKEATNDYNKMPNDAMNVAENYVENMPDYLHEIRRLEQKHKYCIKNEKGYIKSGMGIYTFSTGNVEKIEKSSK